MKTFYEIFPEEKSAYSYDPLFLNILNTWDGTNGKEVSNKICEYLNISSYEHSNSFERWFENNKEIDDAKYDVYGILNSFYSDYIDTHCKNNCVNANNNFDIRRIDDLDAYDIYNYDDHNDQNGEDIAKIFCEYMDVDFEEYGSQMSELFNDVGPGIDPEMAICYLYSLFCDKNSKVKSWNHASDSAPGK